MTAHKSKGLEFDNVILNDDFFYNIKDGELSISQDEARLLYVACTRAKLNLDISKLDKLFDYIVKNNLTAAGMHIPYPAFGKVSVLSDGSYKFTPVKH